MVPVRSQILVGNVVANDVVVGDEDVVAGGADRFLGAAAAADLGVVRSEVGALAAGGDVRGLGPMLALELVTDRESKEPAAELAKKTTAGARERGLILLSCGTYGNVIRILVPLVIDDDDLARGLEILEESLVDARAG